MNIIEYTLKANSKHDGLYAINNLLDNLETCTYNISFYIFKGNYILADFFNINTCFNVHLTNKYTFIKHNKLSAICLNKHNYILDEILSYNYKVSNTYSNILTFYSNELFGEYCISAKSLKILSSYKQIMILHHDFQNIFVINN